MLSILAQFIFSIFKYLSSHCTLCFAFSKRLAFSFSEIIFIGVGIFNAYTSPNLPSISVRQKECTVPRNIFFPLTTPNSFSLSVNSLAASLLYVKQASPRGSAITPFNKCIAFNVRTVVFPLPGPANTTVLF